MNPAQNGEQRRYQLSVSGVAGQQIKAEGQRAQAQGQLTQFIAALRVVEDRLRTDPFSFGELTGDAPDGTLVYHTGSVPPISVRLAIDAKNAVVYIRKVIFHG